MNVSNTYIQLETNPNRYEPINDTFCAEVKQKHPELKGYNVKTLFKEFNEHMIDTMCANRDGVLLPHYLGLLFIGVFPGKSNNLTWELKSGGPKEPRYSMYEMDGFNSRVFYSTIRTRRWFTAGKYWGLVPSRPVNDKKTDAFVKDWKQYIVIPNTRFMNNIVNKKAATRAVQKQTQEILKTYNEFDFN